MTLAQTLTIIVSIVGVSITVILAISKGFSVKSKKLQAVEDEFRRYVEEARNSNDLRFQSIEKEITAAKKEVAATNEKLSHVASIVSVLCEGMLHLLTILGKDDPGHTEILLKMQSAISKNGIGVKR